MTNAAAPDRATTATRSLPQFNRDADTIRRITSLFSHSARPSSATFEPDR